MEVLVGEKVHPDASARLVYLGDLEKGHAQVSVGKGSENQQREEAKNKQERTVNTTFMLQSAEWRTLSRSHWTASGVQDPTLTARSARQHFTA